MAEHDENVTDGSGLLSVVLGLMVLVGMSALPVTIGIVQVFTG